MFSKKQTIIDSEEKDITQFLESTDLYNSKLLYIIPKLPYVGEYTVDLNEHRIDLISKDIYESDSLAEILLLYNGLTINDLTKGITLRAPYLSDIVSLFQNISSIDNPALFLKRLANK